MQSHFELFGLAPAYALDAQALERAYRLAYSRVPHAEDLGMASTFIERQAALLAPRFAAGEKKSAAASGENSDRHGRRSCGRAGRFLPDVVFVQ